MKLEIKSLDWLSLINNEGDITYNAKRLMDAWNREVEPKIQEMNSILEQGTILYSCKADKEEPLDHWQDTPSDHHESDGSKVCNDWEGLLIGVKPRVRPKTSESILREMLEMYDKYGMVEFEDSVEDIRGVLK